MLSTSSTVVADAVVDATLVVVRAAVVFWAALMVEMLACMHLFVAMQAATTSISVVRHTRKKRSTFPRRNFVIVCTNQTEPVACKGRNVNSDGTKILVDGG